MRRLVIDVLPGDHTISQLPLGSEPPPGIFQAAEPGLVSVTRTATELSVVCPTPVAPGEPDDQEGWRVLTVRGPLEFTLTGIMASLAGSLAAAGVPLFAVSTFDTDHILVREPDLARAVLALRDAGHEVHEPGRATGSG